MNPSTSSKHVQEYNLEALPLFANLSSQNKEFIRSKALEFRLTHQNLLQLLEWTTDFEMWNAGNLECFWDESSSIHLQGKKRQQCLIETVKKNWLQLKESSPSYERNAQIPSVAKPVQFKINKNTETILGSCPVFSDQTRCCNLQTLDAVMNCGYECTYCSIQSFYGEKSILFHEDLKEKLNKIEIDPQKTYHIGTGQSSDSLLWGNRNGLLDDLFSWVRSKPNVILELKTKSTNIDYLLQNEVPENVIVTWSLNAESIVKHEEKKTPSLQSRINAAKKVADKGILVGFHLHPIVLFKNWEMEYKNLADKLLQTFETDQVCLLSLGTLTFIKPVIRELRLKKEASKILQMPMENAAGKLSYPFESKKRFFKEVYDYFEAWHGKVFTYLCMEDKDLWQSVFDYAYDSNEAFEQDMKENYFRKIRQIKKV